MTNMATLLENIINHVALPPKLPSKAEGNIDTVNKELLSRLLLATRTVSHATTTDLLPLWESTRRVLLTCKELNAGGRLKKASLLTAFSGLQSNDLLILHVKEQNSGLLIHRNSRSARLFVFQFVNKLTIL